MQVIAKRTLREFWDSNPHSRGPLQAWYTIVDRASWSSPADVKAAFGANVDFIADNRAIFDIGGNKYRLVAHIAYRYGRVLIKFIGTHRQYDAIDPEIIG